MTTTFENIEAALYGALNSALTTTPISWPNIRYEPVSGQSFVEVYLEHRSARRVTVGANPWMEYRGFLRLHVAVPVHMGATPAAVIQDLISSGFAPGSTCTSSGVVVRILEVTPDRNFTQKTWTIFPIEVRWVCEVQG
jgi:hypothetical protein